MITFVTVAASAEAPRSFVLDILGTAESTEAVQSFCDTHAPSEAPLLAVVHEASDETDSWGDHIQAYTSRSVGHVTGPVSLTSGTVYVVPPGVVLALNGGHPVLKKSGTAPDEIPLDPLLHALIDDGAAPVSIVLSKNGRERPERPSIPPSEREDPLQPVTLESSTDQSSFPDPVEAEPGDREQAPDDIEQRLQEVREVLRKRTRKVRRLSRALIHAKENERTRIREILHDDLQQLLFAARMNIQNLQERASLRASHDTLANRAEELLTDGLRVTRGLTAQLTPPDDEQSLVAQFEWLAVRMQEAYGLQVTVLSRGQPRMPGQDCRLFLYRVVQELLFNVVKHAGVDQATLRLIDEEAAIRVEVEDEGNGFDPDGDSSSGGGSGLLTISERVEMIGGTMSLESAPGDGTRVRIVLPHAAGEPADDCG